MKLTQFFSSITLALVCTFVAASSSALAQSQALNAQIEGIVTDANNAAIPNAKVTADNLNTGATRETVSDSGGFYRLPLLPLGAYRVTAEAASFKKLSRDGITLTTGQTATINLQLQTGAVTETVTITSDAPVADIAKIDVGRVMNEVEVKSLPLVSRNPYNFALLQANVTGRPNEEFGVPRINANGYARRTNYQLDGNNNTQTDRAGIRLMPISEVFVSEVQLVTNGFSAEFGGTPGLVMNAVTTAGTNAYHGSGSYRFRRTPFSARPFFFGGVNRPPAVVDDFTAAIGGPIIKDKWQFFTGYERVNRDLAGQAARVVNITAANQTALVVAGVPQTAFVASIPTSQKVNFFIVRTDYQLNSKNNLVGRYNAFRNKSPFNIAGGFNTLERSIDFVDASDSGAAQLISTISSNVLNEFRYQYARRNSQNLSNDNSGKGITVNITNVANFGAPTNDVIQPLQVSNQFINNLTVTRGQHTFKFGGGFNRVHDLRQSRVTAIYTFPTLAAYLAAKAGTTPRGYANYVETFGNPEITYNSVFWHGFAQDDWKVTSRLKINYGLRYDLYNVPNADPSAPLDLSRNFNIDKNNIAPRLGIVYGLREGDRPTVIRASAGVYFEAPLVDIYRNALQNSGSPRFFGFTLTPTAAGAPAFPNTLGSLPAGTTLPAQSPQAVAPDYQNLSAFHTNLQIEQALSNNFSVTLGYIHSRGSHIPVYRNINVINPTSTLADGRPVFASAVNATTRRNPQFNNIFLVESGANSTYNAGVLSLTKRFSKGYQFSANYTWSHSLDDAPERNLVALTEYSQSDPTNRRRDYGNSAADQRHTFVTSFVAKPVVEVSSKGLNYFLNHNQFSTIVTANSGEVFNIVANRDLNVDGINGSDRPLFIGRNTGRTPKQYNWDFRYARIVKLTERFNVEVFGEFVNLWNRNSIFSLNGTVTTDVLGQILDGTTVTNTLPNFRTRVGAAPSSLDSRQFQLGFKLNF